MYEGMKNIYGERKPEQQGMIGERLCLTASFPQSVVKFVPAHYYCRKFGEDIQAMMEIIVTIDQHLMQSLTDVKDLSNLCFNF